MTGIVIRMLDIGRKKTITFDFGDTLASTVPTYPDRMRMAMTDLGFEFTDKEFIDAYHFADYQIYRRYISAGSINAAESRDLLFEVLRDRLKIEVSPGHLKRSTWEQMDKIGYRRELTEFAGDLLDVLKSKGFALAIISNNDGYTFEKCCELGINGYFETIVDSTNVGMVKPDRNIYMHTLRKLNVGTDRSVHIGDLYGADILGGISSGLDVIWINRRKCKNYEGTNVREFSGFKEVLEEL